MKPTTTLHLRSTSSLALVALLAACASSVPLNEGAPVESRTPQPVAPTQPQAVPPSTAATPPATTSVRTVDVATSTLAAANAAGRVVYFDFDSFVLKDEFKPLVDAHAKALVANDKRRMVVEGHTDERGGREYNLALGQKRAETVSRALKLLGGKDAQLEATSYGEERPAATGADETTWSRNRRAELKDR